MTLRLIEGANANVSGSRHFLHGRGGGMVACGAEVAKGNVAFTRDAGQVECTDCLERMKTPGWVNPVIRAMGDKA